MGLEGHYYHQHVIFPNLIPLFGFEEKKTIRFLDLACGQGVLLHKLPKEVEYTGVDFSTSLIKKAREYSHKRPNTTFFIEDLSQDLDLPQKNFTHAAIILALQNIRSPEKVFFNAAKHLELNAPFIMVLNHPYFRVPRQTSWGIDKEKRIQYRRVDRYMSALEIPIQMQPGTNKETVTFSYHFNLATYTKLLFKAGFVVEEIAEWCSDKTSEGGAAKMENRARNEIPLFMAIKARKLREIK